MREGGEFRSLSGGRKKFLYTGPVNSKGINPDDDQWSFSSKASSTSQIPSTARGHPVDLESVWSIRNVGLKNTATKAVLSEPTSVKPEVLNRNVEASFYSRHGGMKGRTDSPSNGNTGSSGGAAKWSSSGHNFSQGSRLNNQPPTFQAPSERGFRNSKQRFKNPSPFDHDANDF